MDVQYLLYVVAGKYRFVTNLQSSCDAERHMPHDTQDMIISNPMSQSAAAKYTNPTIVTDNLGHVVPDSSAGDEGSTRRSPP